MNGIANRFVEVGLQCHCAVRSVLTLMLLMIGTVNAQTQPGSGTPPASTASCTVTAMNRTAPLQSDFSFTIYNIPGAATAVSAQNIDNTTPAPPFRVRAIRSDGTVGETNLAFFLED